MRRFYKQGIVTVEATELLEDEMKNLKNEVGDDFDFKWLGKKLEKLHAADPGHPLLMHAPTIYFISTKEEATRAFVKLFDPDGEDPEMALVEYLRQVEDEVEDFDEKNEVAAMTIA